MWKGRCQQGRPSASWWPLRSALVPGSRVCRSPEKCHVGVSGIAKAVALTCRPTLGPPASEVTSRQEGEVGTGLHSSSQTPPRSADALGPRAPGPLPVALPLVPSLGL